MKLTLAALEGTPNNHHGPWESAHNCLILLPLFENKTRQICFVFYSPKILLVLETRLS